MVAIEIPAWRFPNNYRKKRSSYSIADSNYMRRQPQSKCLIIVSVTQVAFELSIILKCYYDEVEFITRLPTQTIQLWLLFIRSSIE